MNQTVVSVRLVRLFVFLLFLLLSPASFSSKTFEDNSLRSASPVPPPSQPNGALPGWVQTGGPEGGIIIDIVIHPTHPDTLFAGGVRLFKTTNGGATWAALPQTWPINQGTGKLLIHPTSPDEIYAFAGQLFYSPDGGQTFTERGGNRWFTCVAMDPANPAHLLASDSNGQVFYTEDGGDTWSDITSNLPGYRIKALAFGDTGELWAGTIIVDGVGNGLLYRSLDNGSSWNPVGLGQAATSDIQTIFVDPQDTDIVYVGLHNIYNQMFDPFTGVYLLKTENDGTSWTPLHIPFSTDAMVNIMGRAAYDNMLYVGMGGRAYRSGDGGQSWTDITPAGRNGDMLSIAVDPRNTNVLYLPRWANGIVKSSDRGATWNPINQGLLNTMVSLLALADASGSQLYAAALAGSGVYRSTNYGSTWTDVTANGITHPWADELKVSPTDPQTVWYIADVGEVFVTHNSGGLWTKTVNPYGAGFRAGTVSALSIAPSDPGVMYSVKSGFGIFKSASAGAGWQFLHQSEVDYSYSLAVHPTNPDIVFSGYVPKPFQDWAMLRRSEDGGTSWSTVLSVTHSTGITSVAIDPQNPDVLYAGSTGSSENGGGQIYRSANGGDTWESLNPHFTMLTVWGQPQLVGDPGSPSTAYAATWLGGTWKTVDAGQSWEKLVDAPLSSTSLSLDPSNPDIIYASDRTAPKIWKSTDGGLNWFNVADFSSERAFLVNRVLAAGVAVYAATFGPGIHEGKLYRSVNGGYTWEDITNGLPRSVLDIAVHPTNSEIIYVTTHIHGAYKTVNGGDDWTEITTFPDIGGYDIEIDPVSPNIVFAAGMGGSLVPDWVLPPDGYDFSNISGVYRSLDSGATWDLVLSNSNECRSVRFHPSNHDLLFATALSDGFFFSSDGGDTWYNAPLTGLDTYNLTSVWSAGDKIYVGSQGFGVYAGDVDPTSGAVTWVAARSNKPAPDVYNLQIQVDPANSARLYVSANPGGLFRSDNYGEYWSDKNFLTPSVVVDDPRRQGYYNFAINPADSQEVWVGTWGKGIYKSYDGQDFNIGASGSDRVMFGKHINALLFHPDLGVLAATEEGIFRTGDSGDTWVDFSAGLESTQVRTLSMNEDGTLYAGATGYELYYRQPADSSWSQLAAFANFGTFWPIWNNRPLYQYSTLLFHPTDPNIIYFGSFPNGIFKSLDGGASWREYNVGWLNDGVFSLVFHPDDRQVVYAGTYNGVSRSLDGGLHWERRDTGWPSQQWVFSIAIDPTDPDVMYACSKNGENEGLGREDFHGTVMKSLDGGENWFPITAGLDVGQEFYTILVDHFDPQTLYLATRWDGVFISTNGGASWQPWNTGLTNLVAGTNGNNVTNMLALSADGKNLYFGSAGSGVFRRTMQYTAYFVYLSMVGQ